MNRTLFPCDNSLLLLLIVPVAVGGSFWKMIGLWFSAKNSEKVWFVVFVFVNLNWTP